MKESNGHGEPVEEFGEGVIDEIKKDDEEVSKASVNVYWNFKLSIYKNFDFQIPGGSSER